jgi:hypothetical protein
MTAVESRRTRENYGRFLEGLCCGDPDCRGRSSGRRDSNHSTERRGTERELGVAMRPRTPGSAGVRDRRRTRTSGTGGNVRASASNRSTPAVSPRAPPPSTYSADSSTRRAVDAGATPPRLARRCGCAGNSTRRRGSLNAGRTSPGIPTDSPLHSGRAALLSRCFLLLSIRRIRRPSSYKAWRETSLRSTNTTLCEA